jgi:predicted N-formylglutamate amidohydrolase
MDGKSLLGQERLVKELISVLREEGLENISYNYFSAADHQTITKFASARNVPALQLEISSTWLRPAEGDLEAHRFAQLLQAMVRYIDFQQGR